MRRLARALIVLILGTGAALSCRVRTYEHNQHVAASLAEEFLKHAVVERDFHAAHRMLNESARKTFGEAALADAVKKQHLKGYPQRVWATEYEPVLGQPAIQIFLRGENGSQEFYYRVPVLGTVDTGYHPDGIFISFDPFPPAKLRKELD